jgi:hypothetical protein
MIMSRIRSRMLAGLAALVGVLAGVGGYSPPAAAVPATPATLNVTVVDEATDAPLAGAEVSTYGIGPFTLLGTTDAAGQLSVSVVPSVGMLQAVLPDGTYAPGSEQLRLFPGETTNVELRLTPRRGVRGTLSIPGGPSPNSFPINFTGPGGNSATYPNVNGEYSIFWLRPGTYQVSVSAGAYSAWASFPTSTVTISAQGLVDLDIAGVWTGQVATVELSTVDASDGSPVDACVSSQGVELDCSTAGTVSFDVVAGVARGYEIIPTDDGYLPSYVNVTAGPAGSTTTASVSLERGYRITGTVTSAIGGPVANACVTIRGNGMYFACSDDTGYWESEPLPTGTYDLHFRADGHVDEWWDNAAADSCWLFCPPPSDATSVTITSANVDGIDAELDAYGVISGVVTDAATGEPLPGACVDGGLGDRPACTDSEGLYAAAVEPDATSVGVGRAGYSYQEVPLAAVPAMNQVISGIDFALVRSGRIVIDVEWSPGAVGCAQIAPYQRDDEGTYRRAVGSYVCPPQTSVSFDVNPGDYKVSLVRPSATQWWDGAASIEDADVVTISSSQTATVSFTVAAGPGVAGTVVDEVTGAPLAGVNVYAWNTTTNFGTHAITDANGDYRIATPANTTYKIQATVATHQTEYFDNAPSLGSATPVTVGTTQVTDIDLALTPRGVVTGTVISDATGAPIPNAVVAAFSPADQYSYRASTTTASDGSYTLYVDVGTYVLRASTPSGLFVAEYWEDTAQFASATLVTAAVTPTTADFSLASSGSIDITVIDSSNPSAVGSWSASVYASTYQIAGSVSGSLPSNAQRQVYGLAPGAYRVSVWYGGQTFWFNGPDGDQVTVAAGASTPIVVDVAPQPVSGTVVDQDTGLPVGGATVVARHPVNGGWLAQSTTGPDGRFNIATNAVVRLAVTATGFVSEYYADTQTFANAADVSPGQDVVVELQATTSATVEFLVSDAATGGDLSSQACIDIYSFGLDPQITTCVVGNTVVQLNPGTYQVDVRPTGMYVRPPTEVITVVADETSTFDVTLQEGGLLAFAATDDVTGVQLPRICAQLTSSLGYSCTGWDGSPGLSQPLAPGTYSVKFVNPGGRYVSEWYDNSLSPTAATPVTIVAGQTTTISAELSLGSTISGVLRDASSGATLTGCVSFLSGDDTVAHGCTDNAGRYTVAGVPGIPLVANAWVDGYTAASVSLTVSSGQDIEDFDIELERTVRGISGTVLDSSTQTPVADACAYLYDSYLGNYLTQAYCTDTAGTYSFVGLAPGLYSVAVAKSGFVTDWQSVFVGDGMSPVSHSLNTDVVSAAIAGTVTAGGLAVADVCVFLYDTQDTYTGAYGCSGPTGTYSIGVGWFAEADYVLRAFDPDARYGAGSPVPVHAGGSVSASGADVSVTVVASIGGRVTSASSGNGIGSACVYLYNAVDDSPAGVATCTRADGVWALSGVPDGDYKVGIADFDAGHHTWWSGGGSDLATASAVSVVGGQFTDVDASMSVLQGVVLYAYDMSGQPIEGVCMYLYATDGTSFAGSGTCSDGNGRLAIYTDGGTYRLAVFDPLARYSTTWFGGADGPSAADVDTSSGLVITGSVTMGDVEVEVV